MSSDCINQFTHFEGICRSTSDRAPEVEASVRILTSDTRGAETDARNSGRGAAGSGQLLPGTRSAQPRADVTR